MNTIPNFLLLGPLKIKFYGLFIGLGILFVYLYSLSNKEKNKLTEQNIDTSFLISAPMGLLFARIYHILSSLNYYHSHINEIFRVWNGGLGIFGLIVGAFLGLWLSSKIQKISFSSLLNLLFPPILIAQSLGRLGNFFNQEGFGPNHFPTFFLESILCAIAFLVYVILLKKKNKLPRSPVTAGARYSGTSPEKFDSLLPSSFQQAGRYLASRNSIGFSYYLISYGFIRFITEFFRTDTGMVGNIHIGHLISLLMIVMGILHLSFQRRKGIPPCASLSRDDKEKCHSERG